jgi:LAO/AO transport system kinase
MLDMNMTMGDWRPPVLSCVASTGDGIDELWAAVGDHRAHLASSGDLDRRREHRLLDELRQVTVSKIEQQVKTAESGERWDRVKAALLKRELDPYEAAEKLLGDQ